MTGVFSFVVLTYSFYCPMQTQLARAVAGEAQAAFMSVAPSDVLSKFVGESEASIRDLFKKGEE